MKTIAIIQARTGSTRLPGKILMPLGGIPVIKLIIDRIKKCTEIDDVILATTVHERDDPVAVLCNELKVRCFRGSESDVLDRYYSAAELFELRDDDIVVRITGDCPLIDPEVCDNVIALLKSSDADYVSNTVTRSYPDGLDCEAMRYAALKESWQEAGSEYEREHVTQYILKHPKIFKIENYTYHQDFSYMRWTLDEPEDFEFIGAVVDGIGNNDFTMTDILTFLDKQPELLSINAAINRKERLNNGRGEDRV